MPDPKHLPAVELQAEHVGHVFRQLSDEHLAEKRRDDPDVTWRSLEYRLRLRQDLLARGLHDPRGWSLSSARWAFVAAAAAVCLAAGGSGWFLFGRAHDAQSALHYSISDADGQNLGVGPAPGTSELLATEQESKSVRFSDSSVIELQPYTTLRVSVLDGGAVVARLMQGALEVDVHHQERTDYRFQAGDYEVKVVGTAFDLAFDPTPARFELNLHEGRVIVADGTGQTRVVQAGQALRLPAEAPPSAASRTVSSRTVSNRTVSATDQGEGEASAAAAALPQGAHESTAVPAPSYRELARRGQFQAIVTAARRTGVDRVLEAKGPAELHELAQAARYTGQVALAEKVFSHLASEHARSTEGRSAAFFRGRLAEDGGRFRQAQQHYHAYLAQGGGSYAAEALGREMTLVQKSKGARAARPLATEYLRRFPRGAYRDLAQNLAQGLSAQGSSAQGSSVHR